MVTLTPIGFLGIVLMLCALSGILISIYIKKNNAFLPKHPSPSISNFKSVTDLFSNKKNNYVIPIENGEVTWNVYDDAYFIEFDDNPTIAPRYNIAIHDVDNECAKYCKNNTTTCNGFEYILNNNDTGRCIFNGKSIAPNAWSGNNYPDIPNRIAGEKANVVFMKK